MKGKLKFISILCLISFLTSVLLLPNWLYTQSYKDTLFTNNFRLNPPGWIASDGALSLPLPDGRTIWMMGDSHIDQQINASGEIPCLFNAKNCILVQDSSDFSIFETYFDATGSNAFERQFVKMPGDSLTTYWPASGTIRGDTAYTFWQRYLHDTTQVGNIAFSSMVVAKIKLPEIELIEVVPIPYQNIFYGMSVIWDSTSQYYYVYGRRTDFVLFKPLLARCTYDNLLGNWEFYSGVNTWSGNPLDAVPIAHEASAQYTVFYLHDEYHLYFQKNGFLTCGQGRDMFIYSADNPWGPFTNPVLVYTMNDTFDGQYPKTYNGQAHPHFIDNNELLISYNLNKTCPGPCVGNPFGSQFNPDMYRPQFARVPICMFAKDIESPVILSEHSDFYMDADEDCQAEIPDFTVNVSASDNCAATLDVSQSPVAGTTISGSTNTVTLTVTDDAGNIAEVTFNAAVVDNTNPAITCIENQEVNAIETHLYLVEATEFDPSETSDNCGIASVENDFNQTATLENAQLPEGPTIITWAITDIAGNTNTCSFEVTVNAYVSGTATLQQNGISIYPNPANGVLNLTLREPNIESIHLFDLSGKKMLEIDIQSLHTIVDISHLPNGVYVLNFNTGTEIIPVKIIKI